MTSQRHDGVTYHRTDAADSILTSGFRDTSGSYMLVGMTLTGVFVSDVPLGENEGAHGDGVLEVAFPADVNLADFELVEDGKPYREWCVPAAVINARASVRPLSLVELDALAVL